MNIKKINAGRLAPCVLGVAALGCAAWWFSPVRANASAAESGAMAAVQHEQGQVVVPEKSPLRRTLAIQPVAEQVVAAPFSLPATVEADPAKLVKVLSPIAGRIASLDKGLGDAAKTGDVLVRIDSPDLMQAMSDAKKAKSALVMARQALARQRELGASEIAAKRDIEQAENDFEQATSEAARADAKLAQLGAAAPHATQAKQQGSVLSVRSPIAGRVVDLNAAKGGYWNDTTAALMTVADLSTVFVTASVGEKDLGALFIGQSATVVFDAYPDEPMKAQVRYIGELLDPDTRKVKVRMLFDNRSGRLRPGMFAKATFFAKPHQGLLVPSSSVVQSGFYSRVFVEVSPWRFEPRVVQLGPQVGGAVEIVAGLKAGERVVEKDGVLLND
ncbi:efflux RND transporter periplasmic adaptor subunit [Variovorax sp. LjRoot84]|uniref:efflux RND transporter periplasmic adaptor subunit n=1 Tax=Variovorax sp. LjRoot84 TaxID=3342340 RepID=UPI003ECC57BC